VLPRYLLSKVMENKKKHIKCIPTKFIYLLKSRIANIKRETAIHLKLKH